MALHSYLVLQSNKPHGSRCPGDITQQKVRGKIRSRTDSLRFRQIFGWNSSNQWSDATSLCSSKYPRPTFRTKHSTAQTMSRASRYLLVSLPTNISLENDHDEALNALRGTVTSDLGATSTFPVPIFKIGTLDALVQQADDLTKLSTDCEGVVAKVTDSLGSILEGDADKIAQQKNVNDSQSRLCRETSICLLYTSPSPRDGLLSRMPSSA